MKNTLCRLCRSTVDELSWNREIELYHEAREQYKHNPENFPFPDVKRDTPCAGCNKLYWEDGF